MAGLKRSIQTCVKRRSMQPLWLGSVVVLILLYHLIFDSFKSTSGFHGNQVENSDSMNTKEAKELQRQVNLGEKPPFVLSEAVTTKKGIFSDIQDGVKSSLWSEEKLTYPTLYSFKTLSELPAFSKITCRTSFIAFIPNVVHYIWFGKLKLNFLQYLSIRSAALIQRPSQIIVHTDSGEPEEKYWKSLRAEIPCLEVRYLAKPTKIFAQHDLKDPQQQSHIARLQVLYQEGGIYANLNVIFVRPFDKLMMKSIVLGKEEHQYYGNSVILAARGNTFLTMWFTAYNRHLVDWSTYSIHVPYRLHKENPRMPVHIEDYSILRPNFKEDVWIVDKNWHLDENYCVHLYDSRDRIKRVLSKSPLELINMDNTIGQLTRIALFGRPYFEGKEDLFRSSVHSKVRCLGHDDQYIPNILHFVLPDEEFLYKHYLGVRSAARNVKPRSIYIHLLRDTEPDSYYWIRTAVETGCITVVLPPNKKVILANATETEMSDRRAEIVREALLEHGGIYLSFDVILTSSLSSLRANHVVMGADGANSENFDIIMSMKNSRFLSEWFSWDKSDYTDLKNKIERYTMDNPNELIEIVDNFPVKSPPGGWDSKNFVYNKDARCFIVSKKDVDIRFDDEFMYEILRSDTITGEIARIAHFGTPELTES